MNIASQIFALLAALLHVFVFCLESLWFMRPRVYRRFGAATTADAEARRLFAFNQGFYNLFLAAGGFLGLALLHSSGREVVGLTLAVFACACMLSAAVVLFFSAGRAMFRAAFIQGVLPLLALGSWLAFR